MNRKNALSSILVLTSILSAAGGLCGSRDQDRRRPGGRAGIASADRSLHRGREPRDLRRHLQPDDLRRELSGAAAGAGHRRIQSHRGTLAGRRRGSSRSGQRWAETGQRPGGLQGWRGRRRADVCRPRRGERRLDRSGRPTRESAPIGSSATRSRSTLHDNGCCWLDTATTSSRSRTCRATVAVGRWIPLEVRLGSVVEILVDGKSVLRHDDGEQALPAGAVGLRAWQREASYRNLWVKTGEQPEPIAFQSTEQTAGSQRHVAGRSPGHRPGELRPEFGTPVHRLTVAACDVRLRGRGSGASKTRASIAGA